MTDALVAQPGKLRKQLNVAIEAALDAEKFTIPFPLPTLRRHMVGASRAEALIIGGRPGHGKTSFAMWLAYEWAKMGYKGLIISREMMAFRLLHKLIAMEAKGITSKDLRRGELSRDQINELTTVSDTIESTLQDRLIIYDNKFQAEDIEPLVKRHRPDFVLEDFIQLTDMEDSKAMYELKRFISMHIRTAKKYNHAHVAVSQLNRSVETREDPYPRTSDLAESDKLGQLAADVMMVYYPYKIDPRKEPKNRVKIISTKSRFGETGFVDLNFDGDHMAYREIPTRKS